jgi:hypothetical protein
MMLEWLVALPYQGHLCHVLICLGADLRDTNSVCRIITEAGRCPCVQLCILDLVHNHQRRQAKVFSRKGALSGH